MNSFMLRPLSKGSLTATAATTFQHNIDGLEGGRIAISAYEAAGGHATANSLTFMLVGGSTTTSASALAAQATIVLTAVITDLPGASIAANDIVAVVQSDGSYHYSTVSSWTLGTLTLVLNDNFSETVLAGARVFCFGVAADAGHLKVQLAAAASSAAVDSGLFYALNTGDPMVAFHNNATTAGSINYISGGYINR